MYVIETRAPAATPIPGIQHATIAGSENGLERISVWRQLMAPGGATPLHSHDCEEVVMCKAGTGELHVQGRVERFGPNSTLIIPAHVPHQIFSVGEAPLDTLAVFPATPVGVFEPGGEPLELPWRS